MRLTAISSMASKGVLQALTQRFEQDTGVAVDVTYVGGVNAAQRVQAGETFDLVFLAQDALARLQATGHVQQAHRLDWAQSSIAVAVPAGAAIPVLNDADAVRSAVLKAVSIGYSTGPSGVHVEKLFEQWGIRSEVLARIVVPAPGVPVAQLIAQGDIELGFQQLSEMQGVDGIRVVGTLPPEINLVTTFSAGISAQVQKGDAAQAAVQQFLDFLQSDIAKDLKKSLGMF